MEGSHEHAIKWHQASRREERIAVRPWIRQVSDACRARYRRLFPERQIFLRASGRVRFLRLKPAFQAALAAASLLLLGWLVYASVVAVIGNPSERAEARKARYLARELDVLTKEVERLQQEGMTRIQRLEASQRVLEAAVGTQAGGQMDTDSADGDPTPAPRSQNDSRRSGDALPAPTSAAERGSEKVSLLARRTDALIQRLDALQERSARLAAILEQREEKRLARARTLFAALELAQPLAAVEDETSEGRAVGGPYAPPQLLRRERGTVFRLLPLSKGEFLEMTDAPLLPAARRLLTKLAEVHRVHDLLLSLPSAEPADNYYISSRFGLRRDPFRKTRSMHYGLDLAGWRGEPVRAVAAGRVVHAGRAPAYGLMVEIDHGNGYRTRYGHMLRVLVRKGQEVKPGMRIGLIGNTGRSTGTHLHWEVWQNGRPVDPLPFLKATDDVRKLQKLFTETAADGKGTTGTG